MSEKCGIYRTNESVAGRGVPVVKMRQMAAKCQYGRARPPVKRAALYVLRIEPPTSPRPFGFHRCIQLISVG